MDYPKHVAIILDGNGRWATSRGLSRSEGHKEGAKTLDILTKHILASETEVLSVFAFSTENFKRSDDEVNYLMNLFVSLFKRNKKFYKDNNIKILFSGRKVNLRDDVINAMNSMEELTKDNTSGTLNICLNYGAQAEIVDAAKQIAVDYKNGDFDINELNEENFTKYLYQDLPPIDFCIRTSGEMRISNFLLYYLSYAELYFPKTAFPDFKIDEYEKAVEVYNNRSRRFGGIIEEETQE